MKKERGFILVGVLVLVMLCSMIAISLMFRLQADNMASEAVRGTDQAWNAAMSGVNEAMRVAAQATPGSTDWQDLPATFQEHFLYDDGSDRWFFTVWSPNLDDPLSEIRYGLTDEASKLHVNYASTNLLTRFPDLTPELLDGLLDYTDMDSEARSEGGEQEFYDTLPVPYTIKNRALESLDELLMVKGFSPAVLYGEDANFNFRLDPNEDDAEQSYPPDNNDSRVELGLAASLTAFSFEFDETDEGVRRTNINDPIDPLPEIELNPALTNYITALRTNNLTILHPSEMLEDVLKIKDGLGRDVELPSGVGKEELAQVLDLFTADDQIRVDALINVNTAPLKILSAVPGIDEALAESIISGRKAISPERRKSIAWIFEEGILTTEQFKQAAPFLTARSFQFSFRVVGYGLPSQKFRVLDVVIDVIGNTRSIVQLRDITRFGMPFALELPVLEDASMNSASR